MVFIESSQFSKLLGQYLNDDAYRGLQNHLMAQPDAGAIIRESGGVRKVRWGAGNKGKSGGVRVIYYWITAEAQIVLLTMYAKGEQETLSAAQLKRIVKLLEGLK